MKLVKSVCGNCAWWNQDNKSSTGRGACWFNPPTIIAMGNELGYVRPVTYSNEYCGRHQTMRIK